MNLYPESHRTLASNGDSNPKLNTLEEDEVNYV
jgi:hypothetical protein